MFKLEIDTTNDAFKPTPHEELRLILLSFVNKLTGSGRHAGEWNLYDRNGNRVGTATLTGEE